MNRKFFARTNIIVKATIAILVLSLLVVFLNWNSLTLESILVIFILMLIVYFSINDYFQLIEINEEKIERKYRFPTIAKFIIKNSININDVTAVDLPLHYRFSTASISDILLFRLNYLFRFNIKSGDGVLSINPRIYNKEDIREILRTIKMKSPQADFNQVAMKLLEENNEGILLKVNNMGTHALIILLGTISTIIIILILYSLQ